MAEGEAHRRDVLRSCEVNKTRDVELGSTVSCAKSPHEHHSCLHASVCKRCCHVTYNCIVECHGALRRWPASEVFPHAENKTGVPRGVFTAPGKCVELRYFYVSHQLPSQPWTQQTTFLSMVASASERQVTAKNSLVAHTGRGIAVVPDSELRASAVLESQSR
jgi:hypothetical protein